MQIPEGFVALDFVGFTDKGNYSTSEIYMTNDLVHRKNIVWKCLQDNIVNIAPSKESAAWEIFIEGELPFFGSYETFPRPGESERFYVDNTVDPRLMYTWDSNKNDYVLTGGAGGADGGSVDIPITLTAAGWTGTSAPYAQTLTVPQMREGMTPLFFLASEGDAAQYAFSLITGYESGYAEITFYAADIPAVDIDLTLKGIPAQELEYVDNTVVFLVEPSMFTLNDTTQRYEATIPVEGMTEGTGGTWDIVRSGPVLNDAESRIALSITDVDRMDGAVKIVCLEAPEQRYMMSIAGAYPDAEPGTVILAGMQEWFDRVDEAENRIEEMLGPGENIPDQSDLDDYKNPGKYRTLSAASTATLKNVPFTNSAFTMDVEVLGPGDWIRQTVKGVSKLGEYVRLYNPMAPYWTDWNEPRQELLSGLLTDFAEGTAHVRNVFRRGDICEIEFHMTGLNLNINGVYGHIPEPFRPKGTRVLNCSITFNGTVIAGRAAIMSDGRVIQSYGTGIVSTIMLYGTYLI